MRRLVAGVAVVGLLMAAGCGGDDDDSTSSESIEEFGDGFNEVNERFSNIDVTDPGELENALDMLRDLDPPSRSPTSPDGPRWLPEAVRDRHH